MIPAWGLTGASHPNGTPAFADEKNEHGMSDLARQCVAGLCKHHEALTALCAPTVNSYRRVGNARRAEG